MSDDVISRLSPQQAQIIDYLSRGYTLRQAADALEITYGTAKTHRHRAYEKLGLVGLPNPGLRALYLYGRSQESRDATPAR